MSKIIKISPEYIEKCKTDFDAYLTRYRAGFLSYLEKGEFKDNKISYSDPFTTANKKATLYFKEIAWLKMQTLVREFDKEVAWHGLAFRGEDPEKNEYTITDILVYPQEVTGATVNTDQTEYQNWLMGQPDEIFNNIRMQGHSHVNMGTTPSGVDTNLYDQLLGQLEDDMFYIFMIWNKRWEKTIMIYDMASNTMFETADVTVKIVADETGVERFLADAKDKVKTKTYTYTGNTAPNTAAKTTTAAIVKIDDKKKEEPKSATKVDDVLGKSKEPEKEQKKSKKEKKKTKVDGSSLNRSYYDRLYGYLNGGTGYYDDEKDDLYGAFGVYDGRYSR